MSIVYLEKLDINENGSEIALNAPISEYLLSYALFYRQVRLQSSAAFKIRSLENFILNHLDFFLEFNGEPPLITLPLESSISCYEEYLELRLEDLSNSTLTFNPELMAYESNQAIERAKILDTEIEASNLVKIDADIDKAFRKITCIESRNLHWNEEINQKIWSDIESFCINSTFFQTFELEKWIRSYLPKTRDQDRFNKFLRNMYFRANTYANQGVGESWNKRFASIQKWRNIIGIDRYRLARLHRSDYANIKAHPSFQYLLSTYWNLGEKELFFFEKYYYSGYDLYYYRKLVQNVPGFMSKISKIKKEIASLNTYLKKF